MERLKAIPNYDLLTREISHPDFVTVFQIHFILENLLKKKIYLIHMNRICPIVMKVDERLKVTFTEL